MSLTIRQKADAVGSFRHMSVAYMETLARWVPTTPEMELKVVFGRHIWELAQHADALGQRTHELRAAKHYDVRPVDAYAALMEGLEAQAGSGERLYGFYRAALADFDERLQVYLDDTDEMLDEPTVRILERIRTDFARMMKEAEEIMVDRSDVTPSDTDMATTLRGRFASLPGFDFVNFRPERETNLEIFS